MYKLLHVSDTHIRNLKYHAEYRQIFEKIYQIAREQEVDYIVHCGDLAHTKTQLSPEYFELATDFLKNLSDIAPTYIILGNHDGNLKNDTRQDAITPIVQALQHPQLHLLKDSGETHINEDICLNVLSVFDEDNWQEISDKEKVNIALYHGSVAGVVTDTGWVMEHGDHDISVFEGFDYVFLGDIHKTNQILDTEGRVRYCGSTVQQNFGETNDKGFLIWEIEDKDNFDVKHYAIPNPKPFITVSLEEDGSLPEIEIPANSRLRLVCSSHIPAKVLKKATDVAKSIWRPESVVVQNKPGTALSVDEISGEYETENLRDVTVQEKLIKEYLKDYKLEDEAIDKVLDLNRKYNTLAEQNEEVGRNVSWKLKNLEWNNLFNYGEDNTVNFEKLEGIVGIFGKNYSGKSSVVDSLLWSVYNSISKNIRKNVDIINQNREEGSTSVDIQIDNNVYTVAREASKYTRRLHGVETVEAKTSVDFSALDLITGEKTSLNGLDRKETDANIRKVFGTLDDFLLTSMTSQHGSMQFINEGSTKRKEILSKFLDLELFDKKFKLAKDDSSALKSNIRKLEGRDFADEILLAHKDVLLTDQKIEENKDKCVKLKEILERCNEELSNLKVKIASGPKTKLIDISSVESRLEEDETTLSSLQEKDIQFDKLVETKEKTLYELLQTLQEYDWDKLQGDKKKLEELNRKSIQIDASVRAIEADISSRKQKLAILDTVPCGDSFPACRYLVDANKQKKEIPEVEEKLTVQEKAKRDAEDEIEKLSGVLDTINECDKLNKNKILLEQGISEAKLKKEKNKNKISSLKIDIEKLKEDKEEYYKNEEWMKQLRNIEEEKSKIEKSVKLAKAKLDECDNNTSSFTMQKGVLTQKITQLEEQRQELENLRDEYSAFELFSKCMHSNGIVYDIIKRRLPLINQEMAKILANIVNFDVFFEDDGKKLDIYIQHPKYGPRPLELGSGAEKSIASIAIRLALIKTSSLPVGDIFILDEPATALDEENMEGFTRILEMIKNNFKTVIIISHLDALKDVVDKQITIDKIDGFAKVNV
jgi:exonuclease SbcC